jgi:hypothetical protein
MTRERFRRTSLCVLGLVLCAPPVNAQGLDRFAVLATDSVAWQRVLVYAVSTLASDLVATSADTSLKPWVIRLPTNEPQRALLERQLHLLLRARAPSPGDSVVRTLELGPLVIAGDSAAVRMTFDLTRRCPGSDRTSGYGNVATVVVPRHPQLRAWGAARAARITHGDRVGC